MEKEEEVKKGIAIAVSGGGFRATLFLWVPNIHAAFGR